MQVVTTNGAAIRALRRSRGLSVRQLARACGIDESVLSRVETGDRPRLMLQQHFTVADVLGVPVESITSRQPLVETTLPTPRGDEQVPA